MICTHRINPACGILRFLSRFAPRAGLVALRQRFVRRCQGRDPGHTGIRAGRGPLALRCGDKPHRRAERPLGRSIPWWVLFVHAKDLFVEATAPQPPAPLNLMRGTGDRRQWGGSEDVERSMSDEFDGLDATEKAAAEVALIRSRTLAGGRSHHLVGEAVEPPQRQRLMSVKQSKTQKYL